MLDKEQPSRHQLVDTSHRDVYIPPFHQNILATTYNSTSSRIEESPSVLGFDFPLGTEDEIERLELGIKQSAIIRDQYVQYLNLTKPVHLNVVQSFSMFFSDHAMTNYSYYGVERAEYPKTPKKAMKKYDMFSVCMMEAWRSHGINTVSLMEQLKKAVYHISRRRYTRNQVLKRKMKLLQSN
ncbi:uncharacterized protein LOC128744397 isoform X1 [Sabethes cyaneus]|uniref:uncharacterized protein LOC128744397 isoform X1 n=1 Tax=Sabethes cyaneus TaxID=53552 RepID=UPI00237EAC22|nr:uncharacterized protein LOC128744397 isoform X1 [Sabethes cyaneus]